MKLLFKPVSLLAGLLAGLASRKMFARIWAVIDSAGPPRPEERRATWPRLVGALAIEGAIFRLVKGAFDHAAREGFARLTGRWPGEEDALEEDERRR
jgi:Protein of unknown function (DUF4235)